MRNKYVVNRTKWTMVLLWSFIIVLAVCMNILNSYKNMMKSTHLQADLSLKKDLFYRKWVSDHGGVYVPITSKSPANPYLSHIKHRDIRTDAGFTLTLVNPAYMTRQVNEMVSKNSIFKGHLTSLNPVRKETEPDPWERKALMKLKQGLNEYSELTSINGESHYRLIKPFTTEKSCLKCHADQGYRVGDQRGGISVSLSMAQPIRLFKNAATTSVLVYSGVWIFGFMGILLGSSRIDKQMVEIANVKQELIDSEERYNLAINGANVGMWDCNMKTNHTTYNEPWARMLGYELSELKPDYNTWVNLIHPEDKDHVMDRLNRHIENIDIEYDAVFRAKTKSGEWKWINTKGKVYERDENNIPTRIVGIHIDITERKKFEESLRDSEEKYRNMMESMQDSVYICSQDLRIEYLNPSMKNRIGMDATGMICHEAIYKSPDRCPWCDFDQVNRGETVSGEIQDPLDNRDFSIMSVPVYHRTGCLSKLTIARDITQFKAMTAQLLQSEKMASIGQLAAGVAHEINNPIGFISSNLKTLSDYQTDLDQVLHKYHELIDKLVKTTTLSRDEANLIENIRAMEEDMDIDFIMDDLSSLIKESREGTNRVKNIVNDLKNFAHPGEDSPSDVDINHCIETSLNVVWNELKYNVTVKKNLGNLPLITGYPQQLNQVFTNLMVNAAQAIDGQGSLHIETSPKNGTIEIVFSDTGSGIPQEHLPRLFDPFFTTKDVGKGTGLGLNIAFNIIKKHHGTIDVESVVGKGTTFIIKLPDNVKDQEEITME